MNSSCLQSNIKNVSDVSILSAIPEMPNCSEGKKYRQKYDDVNNYFGDKWNTKLQRETSDGLIPCSYPISKCCTVTDTSSSVFSDEVPFAIKNSNISLRADEERVLGFLQNISADRCHESSDEEFPVLNSSDVVKKKLPLATGMMTELNARRSAATAAVNTTTAAGIPSNIQKRMKKTKVKQSVAGNINSSAIKQINKNNSQITSSLDDIMASDEDECCHDWVSGSDTNEECFYVTPQKNTISKSKEAGVSDFETDSVSLRRQIEHIETSMTIDAIRQGEGVLMERCAELREQLIKERAISCKLVTKKTIAEQRAKIAERMLENQHEWKDRTIEDVEVARKNIRQISDLYSEVIAEMKNEKKLNATLQQKVQRDRKKRKRFKEEIAELTQRIEEMNRSQTLGVSSKNELKEELQRQDDLIQQYRSENMELTKKLLKEKQIKQKAIEESNDKITVLKDKMDEGKCRMKIRYEDLKAKIEELQDQVKCEKALHEITKNAYNLLSGDWNKLYEKVCEIRTAIMSVPVNQSIWVDETKLSISD